MEIRDIKDYMADDNNRLEGLLGVFRQIKGKDSKKVADLFETIYAGLNRHILWEEKILFPLIEDRLGMGNMGRTDEMREDHRKIKEILRSIDEKTSRDLPIPDELDLGLINILTTHNQKEKETVYPILDNTLNESEKLKAYQKMKTVPLKKTPPLNH